MSICRVDSKRRIVLPDGRPGDVYDIQRQADGRLLLVRLERPDRGERLSREACLAAMEESPLRPAISWEELRRQTREP